MEKKETIRKSLMSVIEVTLNHCLKEIEESEIIWAEIYRAAMQAAVGKEVTPVNIDRFLFFAEKELHKLEYNKIWDYASSLNVDLKVELYYGISETIGSMCEYYSTNPDIINTARQLAAEGII